MSVQPHFTTTIFIDNAIGSIDSLCSYFSLFPDRLILYNKVVTRMGSRFKFNHNIHTLPSDTIVLVSGSCKHFPKTLDRYSNFRIIFLFDGHYGKRKLPVSNLPLHRLRHVDVGGATTFTSLIGFHNISISPSTTPLRRSIKHFLDYSLRPASHTVDSHQSTFTPEHLLPVHCLSLPINYSTHFSSTGVGVRSLTPLSWD